MTEDNRSSQSRHGVGEGFGSVTGHQETGEVPLRYQVADLLIGHVQDRSAALSPPLNFAVRSGEALAVLGANGSGKSTLLQTLVGELMPLQGSIAVNGLPLDEREAQFRRDVARVFDADAYLPSLTVREHLLVVARGHGTEDASAVVSDISERFGLVEHQHKLPHALSSGGRRRLALASAFVRPAQILILDEPEARLDQGMIRTLTSELLRARNQGQAIIFACHHPDMVRQLATSAVWIAEQGEHAGSHIEPELGARQIERLP